MRETVFREPSIWTGTGVGASSFSFDAFDCCDFDFGTKMRSSRIGCVDSCASGRTFCAFVDRSRPRDWIRALRPTWVGWHGLPSSRRAENKDVVKRDSTSLENQESGSGHLQKTSEQNWGKEGGQKEDSLNTGCRETTSRLHPLSQSVYFLSQPLGCCS